MNVYLGIDLGTSAVKCMAVDDAGVTVALVSVAYPTYSPAVGHVEQEPEEWMDAVNQAVRQCTAKLQDATIRAIGLSGHMTSLVFLDKAHTPLLRCHTIADNRCAPQAQFLMEKRGAFEQLSGNPPLACFGVPRILWLKEKQPALYERVDQFVFAKDYVRGRLTGHWHTEPTDAGNSLLFSLENAAWDDALICDLGIKRSIFPSVLPSASVSGVLTSEAAAACGLPAGIPVICGAADMACSQLGTGAFHEGVLSATIGTSGQLCIHTPRIHPAGIGKITYHAGAFPHSMYAMASIFTGGLAVNWTYQMLFNKSSMEAADFSQLASLNDAIAQLPPGAEGVCFLPFLTGSGSPRFNANERAAFLGLSAGVSKAHYFRAAMEGVAYHIRENLDVFQAMDLPIRAIRLGGGGTKLPVWRQIIADVLSEEVSLLDCADASTLGACMLAYAALHPNETLPDISDTWVHCAQPVTPNAKNSTLYQDLYAHYRTLVQRLC